MNLAVQADSALSRQDAASTMRDGPAFTKPKLARVLGKCYARARHDRRVGRPGERCCNIGQWAECFIVKGIAIPLQREISYKDYYCHLVRSFAPYTIPLPGGAKYAPNWPYYHDREPGLLTEFCTTKLLVEYGQEENAEKSQNNPPVSVVVPACQIAVSRRHADLCTRVAVKTHSEGKAYTLVYEQEETKSYRQDKGLTPASVCSFSPELREEVHLLDTCISTITPLNTITLPPCPFPILCYLLLTFATQNRGLSPASVWPFTREEVPTHPATTHSVGQRTGSGGGLYLLTAKKKGRFQPQTDAFWGVARRFWTAHPHATTSLLPAHPSRISRKTRVGPSLNFSVEA
ncbi:hypothetical protein CPB86DRAFT_852735 [Serendipita vermifera]|nr:hypothetical protein CPB86DRAFT_852735 [Serendipita vermifera]